MCRSRGRERSVTLSVMSEGREIRFGQLGGSNAGFVLEQPFPSSDDVAFLLGESFIEIDGRAHHLRDQNGIEPLALGNLRADVESILRERQGGLRVTDHDTSLEVALWVDGQRVLVFATVPNAAPWSPPLAEAMWNQPLGAMTFDDLAKIATQIDATEREFGPLVGHCGCGAPPRSWPSFDPRQ